MTLDEYRDHVLKRLRLANTRQEAVDVVQDAAEEIRRAGVNASSEADFWAELGERLGQPTSRFANLSERQAASALTPIIQAAQAAIAAKLAQAKKQ